MPLTTRERIGGRALLESLDTTDLFSLAGTVTKKKSTACTRAEAIDTILWNSLSAYELLNRRKVLRDIIAAYLKNEGVPLPPKITKAEVVLKTLAYWNEQGSCIPGISSSGTQKEKATSPDGFGWFDYDLYNTRAIGLSAQERVGCRKVLKSLDLSAISSLAGTVSKKKSRACTSAEEIDIILEKSKSAYELLNRKKVLRDAIAAYLKNEGVPIPQNITKAGAVQKALVYWKELDSSPPSSVMQRQKATSSHFSPPFYFHTSEPSIRSPLEDATRTPNIGAQTQTQYLHQRNRKISQPPTLHQSADEKRNTKAEKTAPHAPTSSELQIKQQSAHAEANTEKIGATAYTGVKQRNRKISQPPTLHQSADEKRNTKAEKEDEDTSWIWTDSLNGSKPFSMFSSLHTAEE